MERNRGGWRTSAEATPAGSADLRAESPVGARRTLRRLSLIGLILCVAAVAVVAAAELHGAFKGSDSYPPPSAAALAGMTVPGRVAALAESQVGYSTEPGNTYCNKFSAYWGAGRSGCPSGEKSEQWCADFAAWAWQEAGVHFDYGFGSGELNAAAASFYEWAVANGKWHPATSWFVPSAGDVAVYGLTLGASPTAAHVAIVIDDSPGQSGPDVVNGDGDQTGFSRVEAGTDQEEVVDGQKRYALSGYVSLPQS